MEQELEDTRERALWLSQGGYVDCEFLFPTQTQMQSPGVSAAGLATVPVSLPKAAAAAKLARVPLQRGPAVSESRFKLLAMGFVAPWMCDLSSLTRDRTGIP